MCVCVYVCVCACIRKKQWSRENIKVFDGLYVLECTEYDLTIAENVCVSIRAREILCSVGWLVVRLRLIVHMGNLRG